MEKAMSRIVKNLINECANIDYNTLADALNISVQSCRNKISRNSFSISDLSIICYMTEHKFIIQTDNSETQITPELFLSENDLKRLIEIKFRKNKKIINTFTELAESLDEKTLENIINKIKEKKN